MPCRDEWAEQQHVSSQYRQLQSLSVMLCRLCRRLRQDGVYDQYILPNSNLDKWWRRHHREDLSRIKSRLDARKKKQAAEKHRRMGLSKLSPEEREALGIGDMDDHATLDGDIG